MVIFCGGFGDGGEVRGEGKGQYGVGQIVCGSCCRLAGSSRIDNRLAALPRQI